MMTMRNFFTLAQKPSAAVAGVVDSPNPSLLEFGSNHLICNIFGTLGLHVYIGTAA